MGYLLANPLPPDFRQYNRRKLFSFSTNFHSFQNVKLTRSIKKRKRKSNWASGKIKRRSTRRAVENDEMIDADETTRDADEAARDFDETTRESMVLDDNCENSNDSNKGKTRFKVQP